MIQICSLDFLRKETFDTDIMTVDGRVLCSKGDKVSPEIILKLYFKEIYAKEELIEEICEMPQSQSAIVEQAIIESSAQLKKGNAETAEDEVSRVKTVEFSDSTDVTELIIGQAEATEVSEKLPSGNHVSVDSEIKDEKAKAGPRKSEATEEEQEEIAVKGPRSVDLSTTDTKTDSVSKAKAVNESASTLAEKSIEAARLEAEKEAMLKDPVLEFDEAQAKRIVENSLMIGKMLKFSPAELKDLEQVAYNCNIGISEFKKSDMTKKDFRKMKAYASYKKLQQEETVPPKIAEMVKFTAMSLASDSTTLSANIPIDNIVGITSYYEDSLSQNISKEDVLLKMLQLGGNHFNIFVLHKFIRMMRDKNG